MSTVKHILGISGGKDSAALSIYLNENHLGKKYSNLMQLI
jgi:tRNA(Ile)-lysidine synthase TilS/MesJ